MAADKKVSAASRSRTRLSGWVLSQFQVTLAICGILVGFLVCFGFGFLSGVWFQTQEQMMPHDDAITLADNQLDRERKTPPAGREMTFYSALTSRDAPESKMQPRVATAPVPQSTRSPLSTVVPAASSATASPSPPSSRVPGQIKPKATEPDEAEKMSSAPLKAAVSPRRVASEPPGDASVPPKPRPEVPLTVASAERFYSIQVGSFRKVEQAYRLQDQLIKKGYQARIGLSIVAGKGAWYRVRVGRYANRGSANKTAQRLQKKENIDVLVMRVSS